MTDEGSRGEEKAIDNYQEGETSENTNPMDGFGTKQGRTGESGATRQEVEKT
jgi:hypothetical protein